MIDSTLIYPNIHFKDSKSIKEALLLYNNVYRIVPDEILPKDSKEIEKFNKEYDLIKEISPAKYIQSTYKEFQSNLTRWRNKACGMCFSDEDETYERLHKGKVYDKLREIIIEDGILDFDGTWFRGDDSFIGSYMTYLALEISTKNSLGLVTYEDSAWTCQEFLNYDGEYATYFEEKTHSLIGVYLKDYIPSNIKHISFDNIIKFRERHKDERRNLLKKFLEFQDEIESREDKTVIDDKIKDQIKSLSQGVKDFKDACTFFKTDKFFGLKIFTMPIILQQAEPFIKNPELKQLLIPFGVTLGILWSLYSSYRSIEDMKKSNPYSYLVALQKFHPKEIPKINYTLTRDIHEFLED